MARAELEARLERKRLEDRLRAKREQEPSVAKEISKDFLNVTELLGRGAADLPLGVAQTLLEMGNDEDIFDIPGFDLPGDINITVGDVRTAISNVTRETGELAAKMNFGQFIRIIPQVLQAVGAPGGTTAATTRIGRTVTAGAKGTVAGSLGTGVQPIEEPIKERAVQQRAQQIESGAMLGFGIGTGLRGSIELAQASKQFLQQPINAFFNHIQNKLVEKGDFFLQQATKMEDLVGEGLTFAQRTGSRAAEGIEGSLRRKSKTADLFFEKARIQVNAGLNKLTETIDKISPLQTAEQVGIKIKNTFNTVVRDAVKLRSAQGAEDFGVLDLVAGKTARIFSNSNYLDALTEMVRKSTIKGADKVTVASGKEAQRILSQFIDEDGAVIKMTAEEFQGALRQWGSAAHGTGEIFKDLGTAGNRQVARKLKKALEADLDESIELQPPGGFAKHIETARNNWRHLSGEIEKIEDTFIASKLKGNAGKFGAERVVDTLKGMKPSEMKETILLLSEKNPEIASDIFRALVDDAITAAKKSGRRFIEAVDDPRLAEAEKVVPFSGKIFVGKMADSFDLFEVLEGMGAKGGAEVKLITDFIRRVSKDTGLEQSATSFFQNAGRFISNTINPKKWLAAAVVNLTDEGLADFLINSQTRGAMTQVIKTAEKPNSLTFENISFLSGIIAGKQQGGNQ